MSNTNSQMRISVPMSISPTQVPIARACMLRFILDASIEERDRALPSGSGYRYAGIVFHRVIAAARRGEAGDPVVSRRVEELWERELEAVQSIARGNGDECWVPFEDTVHNLERTRLKVIRMAKKERVYVGQGTGNTVTETWLTSNDVLVKGQTDAIDVEDGQLVLRDFKSGSVRDDSGQVKEAYCEQLVLYAALHYEDRGAWPDRLELVDGVGRRSEVSYTH